MNEQWKPIPDFPGYEVSDQGRVRSYWKGTGRGGGMFISQEPQRLLKQFIVFGYPKVNIRQKQFFVHRLVLKSFIGSCPPGMEARHKDGIRTNVCLSNLQWGTRSDNYHDRHAHGTDNNGARNGKAKLTDEDIRDIRLTYASGAAYQKELAKEYGVCQTQISKIVRQVQWTHIR